MLGTVLTMCFTALALSLLGVLLLYRQQAMLADAISHSVLLGIVLAFFVVHDLGSPWLMIGATVFGLLTVFFIERLQEKHGLASETATAVVFPVFFALAILLISLKARNAHLDTDIVLMGEVIYASFRTTTIFGLAIPTTVLKMSLIFTANLLFVVIFYKELKVSCFDKEWAGLARLFAPSLFYALMGLASLSFVAAFDAVGAILVVALTMTPAAIAALLARSFGQAFLIAAVSGVGGSLLGIVLAFKRNVSVSGMAAAVVFGLFLLVFLFGPRGMLFQLIRRAGQRRILQENLLLVHIGHHLGEANEHEELGTETLFRHVNWHPEKLKRVIRRLQKKQLITTGCYRLSDSREGLKTVFCLTKNGEAKLAEIRSYYRLSSDKVKQSF